MRSLIAVAAVPLVLILGACTAGDDPTPGASSEIPAPQTSGAESPGESPSTGQSTSGEGPGVEQQAALDVAEQYFVLHNELAQNPEGDLQPLLDLTTGVAAQQVSYEFDELRANGEKRVGDAVYHILDAGELDEFEGDPFVLVMACTDSADSDIVNAETGESVAMFEGSLTLDWLLGVVQQGDEWLVSTLEITLSDSCEA